MARAGVSVRRAAARGAGLVSLAGLAWLFCFAHGCADQRCDGSFIVYGNGFMEGAAIGPNAWESTPFEGRWLDFSHARTIFFDLRPQLGRRRIIHVTPYVSAVENQSKGGVFTLASGNLAVTHVEDEGWFTVRNDTCADYFVRVVAELAPLPPPSDGGADADEQRDGGTTDATVSTTPDASADASSGDSGSDAAADSPSDAPSAE